MVICLERGADLHMAQQMPLPLTVSSVKSRMVLPFWYRLTQVVPDKGPLNGCVCKCVVQILDNFLQVVLAYNSMLMLLMQVESPLLCSIIDQADDDGLVPIPDQ